MLHEIILDHTDDGNYTEKNAENFAELDQCLDNRSLSLVVHDIKDDDKKDIRKL